MDTTEYEAPHVTVLGTLESFTQGHASGSRLDASFPSGTAFDDLTFSWPLLPLAVTSSPQHGSEHGTTHSSKVLVRCDDMVWQEIDGELVLLDLRTSIYFALNRTATQLWSMLARGDSEADLAARLVGEYGRSADQAEQDVRSFLEHLRSNDLLAGSWASQPLQPTMTRHYLTAICGVVIETTFEVPGGRPVAPEYDCAVDLTLILGTSTTGTSAALDRAFLEHAVSPGGQLLYSAAEAHGATVFRVHGIGDIVFSGDFAQADVHLERSDDLGLLGKKKKRKKRK
jgi:hypothetical protein